MKASLFKHLAAALATGVIALTAWSSANAQAAWPNRPVKMIIPFAPGGGTDVMGRLIAGKLGEALGQAVVVENKPGAGGSLGTAEFARMPADGYTLLLGSISTHAISPGVYAKLSYDPVKDFAPMGQVTNNPFVVAVPAALPVKTVAELVALAKSDPTKYNYASSGNGGGSHLAAALFVHLTGMPVQHIPYKSQAPALNDLLAGRVAFMFDNITAMQQHIQAGTLRALGTSVTSRPSVMKDVPTLIEAGVPGYEFNGWVGMWGPAGTPPEIVNRVNTELVRIMAMPDMVAKFAALGAEAQTSSPQELSRLVASEVVKWKRVIQIAGVKAE